MPNEITKLGWVVDTVVRPAKGDKYYEYSFAFDVHGNKADPDDWTNKDFIGTADVLIVNNDKAMVLDYKTGSSLYPNPKQLERMAICTMLEFSDVQSVFGILVFLDHNPSQGKGSQSVERTYHRKDLAKMMAVLNSEKAAVMRDLTSGFWEMKSSPLCPWCPVTDCPKYTPPKEKTK
jgi:PD-(D/E)XK nuclease superfamily